MNSIKSTWITALILFATFAIPPGAESQCTRSCGEPSPGSPAATLYSFSGPPDRMNPQTDLVEDTKGNLYGTTSQGGVTGGACGSLGCGVVFKLDTTGKETVLYSFAGEPTDGADPMAGLILDVSGNLYGTTSQGGTSNFGTVFKLDTTGKQTVLYSFTGKPTDGADPMASLVLDAAGNLYGTTAAGSDLCYIIASLPPTPATDIYCGAVFKLDTSGTEMVLHSFTGSPDGAIPDAGLILDAAGNLYGTTSEGGAGRCYVVGTRPGSPPVNLGCGSVFKLDTAGKETVLYSFSGTGLDWAPHARLFLGESSNLYGTTSQGGITGGACGNFGCGIVFELTSIGKPADFSLQPASSSLTTQSGGQMSDVITAAAQNGPFANAVQLTCAVTGPSPIPTCALSPSAVTPGANSASSTLTVTAPTGTSMFVPPIEQQFNKSLFAMLLPLAFLGITQIIAPKKVRRHSWILCGFLLPLVGLQMACGGGNNGSSSVSNQGPTTSTTYTVVVTGDSDGGSIEHMTQITVTVQ